MWKYIFVIFITFSLTGCDFFFDPACSIFVDIANGDAKVEYLENWINENVGNKEIMNLIGSDGYFKASEDKDAFFNLFNF